MFPSLLNAIFLSTNINGDAAQQAYVASLKDVARKLWSSYQSDNIVIDYNAPNTQFVYMTRYFPFYTALVKRELIKIHRNVLSLPFLRKDHVIATLFCSGPLPEACGISELLATNTRLNTFVINTLDLNVNGWNNMRTIVKSEIIDSNLSTCNNVINPVQYDLIQPISEVQLQLIETSDLLVFQNCLNEIPLEHNNIFEQSIDAILDRMPTHAVLVIIERGGYNNVNQLLLHISQLANDKKRVRILTDGIQNDTYVNPFMKASILKTACKELYDFYKSPPDGLVLSPSIRYQSLIMVKF